MKILNQSSLKPFHTFSLDVQAKKIIEAHSKEDFLQIWKDYSDEPKLILGEGSNVLFCENYQGIVILNRLMGIKKNETNTHWHLHVAGGENWHELVIWTLEHGILGLENLALIPGLVGSSPIQNIGAYGSDLQEFCDYVDLLMLDTGETKRLTKDECEFGYRDSIFKNRLKDKAVILAVGFKFNKSWQPNLEYGPLKNLMDEMDFSDDKLAAKAIFERVCQVRQEKLPDPKIIGNAGSFFKNPVVTKSTVDALLATYPNMPNYPVDETQTKLAAGWLIEQAGLKGHQLGGAAVHQNQALVLINKQNAKSQDVVALANFIIETVQLKFGVSLTPEVRFFDKTKEISWK